MKAFRGLIGLFVCAAAIYLLWQVIPPFLHNYQFQDSIENLARFSSIDPRLTEEDIRQKVFKAAQEYEIPVTAEQIKVSRNGNEVAISTDYVIHLALPVRPVDLDFHPTSTAKPIM